jgi:hypothetical protein
MEMYVFGEVGTFLTILSSIFILFSVFKIKDAITPRTVD